MAEPFVPLTREQLLANPPFQPIPGSVPTTPVASAAFNPESPSALAGEGINPQLFGEPGQAQIDRHAALAARADQLQKQQSSFMPNAIAIGAMLTGNFGPMMQLEEQKRKTQIAQVFGPIGLEATKLSQQGQHDQAEALINDVAGRVGDRSPELTQFFGGVRGEISKQRSNWRDMVQVADYMKGVPDTAHPDVLRFRDFAQKAVKNQTPMSASLMENLFNKAIPHMQMINNQALQQGGMSGQVTSVPLPEVQSEKQLEGAGGMRVAAHNQMSTADLTNIMRLKEGSDPIILGDGRRVSFGDPLYTKTRNDWISAGMPFDAALEVGKQIPYDPFMVIALQDAGATNDQIATRTPTPQQIDTAIVNDTSRKAGIASAAEFTKIRQNPLLSEQSNLVNLDLDSGLPIRGGLSIADAEKRGVRFVRLPLATFENKYQPSVEALTGLANLDQFITAIGDPKTLKERIVSGGNRWLSDKAKVALAEGVEESKLFQKLINDAIEEATRRNGISQDDKDVRMIKELTTGIGADPAGARTIVREIQKKLSSRLYQETGEAALAGPAATLARPAAPAPRPAQPGAAIPGVPTRNVPQVPAAGVTPGSQLRQPGAGYAPVGTSTYGVGTAAQRRAESNRRAAEILNPIIDQGTQDAPTTPDATPTTPTAPKQFVKPGTLR